MKQSKQGKHGKKRQRPAASRIEPVPVAELQANATVDLMTAARALGIGRTKAYKMAQDGEFPCPLIRIGEIWTVPTPGLLALLGITTGT